MENLMDNRDYVSENLTELEEKVAEEIAEKIIEEVKLEVKCECEPNLTDDDSDSSPEAVYHGNYPQDLDNSLIN
jgi:L-fucose isomerase-like protein